MPDRTIAPAYKPVTLPPIPKGRRLVLDNGIPLHWISTGDQEAIRIECLFPAASWMYPHPKVSFFAVKMLLEGTARRSSAQLNQALDLYGAFTETVHTPDYYGITLYTMPRFLENILPILAEVLDSASFPENEWDNLQNIILQQLKVNREQSSWLAGAKFRSALFGENSRYGYSQNEADISALTVGEIRSFYASHIRETPFYLFASGKVEDRSVGLISTYLGKRPVRALPAAPGAVLPGETGFSPEKITVEKPGSSQYTLRLGKKVPGRTHPDYFKSLVTNEILGGYFGSRLMKNIREEKGLTYGISSHLPAWKDSAYFMIATDVNKDSLGVLSDEIRKELASLQSAEVPEEELERVRNVIAGEFARTLGTAFEIGDLHQTTVLCKLPEDFYDTYLDNIRSVTADDVREVARDLLDIETMTEVIVG